MLKRLVFFLQNKKINEILDFFKCGSCEESLIEI